MLVLSLLAGLALLGRAAAARPVDDRSAADVVAQLGLAPNVEGGYYAQTFEDPVRVGNRSISTLIYYLLEGAAGPSRWHRVDAAEVWHHYAGAPLEMSVAPTAADAPAAALLGPDIFAAQAPQRVVPRDAWQSVRSLGAWSLVGTTVAPGFVMSGFELAPPGWVPGANSSSAAAPADG